MSCREFPEDRPAYMEVPDALWSTWVSTSGRIEVRGMWVLPPRQDTRCADRGCFPGERLEVSGRQVFPGRKYC